MSERVFVMGVDFGSDSARAVVVDARGGEVMGQGTAPYRRWAEGRFCAPAENRFRQHPLDYLEALESCTAAALAEAGRGAGALLRGVCVDATGSTPAPADASGTPLALLPEFAENPNAMFFLWKDHTAGAEADEINRAAASWSALNGPDFLRYQGKYSSEWFWAKILQCARADAAVRDAAHTWIEECEWITAELCGAGAAFARSACAAGHKALWHSAFGGLPDRAFLAALDPHLGKVYDSYTAPVAADRPVGMLSAKWRARWGAGDVVVAGSLFDAHAGAVGCGVRPGVLVKVIGTSAVDMLVEKAENITAGDTKELFGMAENSIVPGLVGIEAGQAAFGDVFRWLERIMCWRNGAADADGSVLAQLNDACAGLPPPKAVALDWFNGRRYPGENSAARSCIMNLDLSVDAPALYRSLVAGVAFGAKRMLEGFLSSGVRVDEVVCAGGVARKSPYVMQTLADVLGREVGVSASEEACAKGAAMFAAVAAGLYPTLLESQAALRDGIAASYRPNEKYSAAYAALYREYLDAGKFMDASPSRLSKSTE